MPLRALVVAIAVSWRRGPSAPELELASAGAVGMKRRDLRSSCSSVALLSVKGDERVAREEWLGAGADDESARSGRGHAGARVS
jgi:hypothetical protein